MFKWILEKMGFLKKTILTAAVIGTTLTTAAVVTEHEFLAETAAEGSQMTAEFEGLVLENYIDVVGVETWCYGETQLGRMEAGYTQEHCLNLFKARYNQYSGQLYDCYDEKSKRYVTPAMHATFTDVFYNTGAKCKTGMIRNLKRGKPVEACNYILRYKRAGGKDCSVRRNNCYGVWDRRLKSLPMCLKDAEQLPPEGIGKND